MYLRHFKLKSKPFALNPDPAFLFQSEQHSRALTMLEYAIESQTAFCMLTGEIGSGKTTLIRHLIQGMDPRITVGLISNTHQRFRSIHPWALSAFGVVPRDTSDIAAYETLTDFVIGEYAKGRRSLLILDEAQNLSIRTLEELRLLSNLNSERDVALQVLLVGQPELRAKIAAPRLRQFAQRIGVDFHLRALSLVEAEAYVRHRIRVAGGPDNLFQQSAVRYIHKLSGGVPRLINQLCDISLVYAFADQMECVTTVVVGRVLQDRQSGRSMTQSTEVPQVSQEVALTLSPPPGRAFREPA